MPARSRCPAIGAGMLAGVAIDQALGDPCTGHPVAVFGATAARLEAAMWRDTRAAGAAYAALLVGAAAGLGRLLSGAPRLVRFAGIAGGTWAVVGGRSLVAEADAVAEHLTRGDLRAARQRLTHLVGRRTEQLDETEIARAVIESVAENTSDAVVAPLFWGAVAGLPGLLGYRALNTLDAMVGHHDTRYENFGWASARLDDVANYLPARLTAVFVAGAAPLVGGQADRVGRVVRRDGRRHPSPNAGIAESAFAAALGVRLGGRNEYGARIEQRPILGREGRVATAADIRSAARLSRAAAFLAAAICAAPSLFPRRARRGKKDR